MKFLSSREVVVRLAVLLLEVINLPCFKECALYLSEKFSIYKSTIGKLVFMCVTCTL